MNKYLVSVIVPTYTRRELLEYTLDSLLRQNISPDDFEVIVSDDGSTDDTRNALGKYKDCLHLKYLYQEDRGYRPASARNAGIRNAEGEICLFIDSGVLLNVQCVREHVFIHRNASGKMAAVGYVYGFDQDGTKEDLIREMIVAGDPEGTIQRLKAAGAGLDIREKYYRKYGDRLEDLPAPWALFWTCNVSARRKDLEDVGFFDEVYDGKWGCEDNDLGLRLWQHGVEIRLCRGAESVHFPHGKDMEQKVTQGYANCQYMHHKFGLHATGVFMENYRKIVRNESVDINELLARVQA